MYGYLEQVILEKQPFFYKNMDNLILSIKFLILNLKIGKTTTTNNIYGQMNLKDNSQFKRLIYYVKVLRSILKERKQKQDSILFYLFVPIFVLKNVISIRHKMN